MLFEISIFPSFFFPFFFLTGFFFGGGGGGGGGRLVCWRGRPADTSIPHHVPWCNSTQVSRHPCCSQGPGSCLDSVRKVSVGSAQSIDHDKSPRFFTALILQMDKRGMSLFYLSTCLFICLPVRLSKYLSLCLTVCPPTRLSVWGFLSLKTLSVSGTLISSFGVCVCVCLSVEFKLG